MANYWNLLRKIFFLSWFFSVPFLFTESFSYEGFVLRHTKINLLPILGICLASGLLSAFDPDREEFIPGRFGKIIPLHSLNRILFFLGSLGYLFLLGLETSNYHNYVFSKFHINIDLLLRGVIFLGLIEMFMVIKKIRESGISLQSVEFIKYKHIRHFFKTGKTYSMLFLFSSLLLLVNNLTKTSRLLFKDTLYVVSNPLTTYEEKMRHRVGAKFYDYTQFVKDNTPEDAIILIPPQGYPWPQTGNKFYLRYFLYPRTLINGDEFKPNVDLEGSEVDFVLVVWGESSASQYGYTNGWPKFDVKADSSVYWKEDGSVVESGKDYSFSDTDYNDWGLVEIKK